MELIKLDDKFSMREIIEWSVISQIFREDGQLFLITQQKPLKFIRES
jgi:hypothetical protein